MYDAGKRRNDPLSNQSARTSPGCAVVTVVVLLIMMITMMMMMRRRRRKSMSIIEHYSV